MNERHIDVPFVEYGSLEELDEADLLLAKTAIKAMGNAYAPYSHFHVGAAVRMSNSKIVSGANQENAAFPSGLCAERTAMFAASAEFPDKDMLAIAIAGGVHGRLTQEPVTPCGACRQVMAQYQAKSGKPMAVILIGEKKIWKFDKVDYLLPFIFDAI